MILLTDIALRTLMNLNSIGLEQTPGIRVPGSLFLWPRLIDLVTLIMQQLSFFGC